MESQDQPAGPRVVTRKKRVVVNPTTAPTGYVAPDDAPQQTAVADDVGDGYANDAEAWDDFRPDDSPTYDELTPALKDAVGAARRQRKLSQSLAQEIADEARDEGPAADDTMETLKQVFGDRDAGILYDTIVGQMPAADVATKYGVSRGRVAQIAGGSATAQKERATKIAAAQKRLGWTDEYVRSLGAQLSVAGETEVDATSGRNEVDLEASESAFGADTGADRDPSLFDAGFGTADSIGGSTSNWKDTLDRLEGKTLSANDQAKLDRLKDRREAADAAGNEAEVERIDAELSQLEADYVTPQELAAAATQQVFELQTKIDTLRQQIETAEATGSDFIATKNRKIPLTEVMATIAGLEQRVGLALKRAQDILQRGSARTKLGKATDANAEQSTASVPVGDKPKAGTRVRKQDTQEQAPADQGQTPVIRTPQEQYEALTNGVPGAPAYDSITGRAKTQIDDLARREQLDLASINRILSAAPAPAPTPAPAPAAPSTTDEQREMAESLARDVGGVIAWQEGPLALIRGYAVLTGAPVYSVAIGSARSRVDVESFTGNAITPEQKARLVKIKQDLEAAEASKPAFITYDQNGLAVSQSVPAELAGIAAGWKDLLNLTPKIYITTVEDARANRDKFTGTERVIGSAALDANEAGSMRRMQDGSYYIAFTKGTSRLKMLEILAHEMGHIHQREAFDNAPADLQRAIRAEHDKFIQANAGKTGKQFVEALRARAVGRTTRVADGAMADDMSSYWKSFSEWYADQVSKWATTSEKPVSVVEKFFAKLAAAMKRFYYSLKGEKYLPNETVKQFLDAVADRTIVIDNKSAARVDERSESMLAGVKSFVSQDPQAARDLKAKLATAKLMYSNGDPDFDIWEATGWFFHEGDRQWRYEIPDTDAKFKTRLSSLPSGPENPHRLGDVLDHPKLFAVYPQLADYELVIDKTLSPSSAWFSPDTKMIGLAAAFDRIGSMESLLHELQHAVQDIEGFSRGGDYSLVDIINPESMEKLASHLRSQAKDGIPSATGMTYEVAKELAELTKAARAQAEAGERAYNIALGGALLSWETGKPLPEETPAVVRARRINMRDYARFKRAYTVVLTSNGLTFNNVRHELYELIAGEAEARLVANRSTMSEEELRSVPPRAPVQPRNALYLTSRSDGSPVMASRQAINSLPKQAQQPVRTSVSALGDLANKALDLAVFTSDLVDRAVKAGLTAARDFGRLVAERAARAREVEREVERIADMYALVPEAYKGTGPRSVNQLIFDSTRRGKWAYGDNADPDMAKRFEAMPPAAQRFIRAVFTHGDQMLARKKGAVLEYTQTEYDARIANETDANAKAELLKEKQTILTRFDRLFKVREGKPYAPIKRFGDYVVIAKSRAYLDAEAANDREAMSKLEKDEDHYQVSFTDTKTQARLLADQLTKDGRYADSGEGVYLRQRDQHVEQMYGGDGVLRSLSKLRSRIDASDQKGSAQLLRMVSDLYLEALAEDSARKSEMRRRGIAGEVDMLQSFARQGRSDAQFMASVEYNDRIQESLLNMAKQANKARDDGRASEIRNELLARYNQTLEAQATPLTDKITRLSSVYFLATSPAYYLANLTQPFMMSLPAMAGRHGYGSSSAAFSRAYAQLTGVMKSARLFDQGFDFSKVPADVRDAVQQLVNRGKIDIGMETELGEFKIEGDSIFSKTWNRVDKGLRMAVQKVESINRLSTAMAAYRLELARTGSKQAALDYADRILTETHGDYTNFNAPRVFNTPIGRVALQFRKFQLIQLSFYAKLIRDAFTNPAERAVAMKSLTYALGHTAIFAGVMGLPGYAAVAWLINAMLSDDGEKYDLTGELRKAIGDETVANLILRGAPTLVGADLSGKVGAGNMLSIMPFSNADLTTPGGVAQAAGEVLMGAAGGMAVRMMDGVGLMGRGDWYRGLELLVPKGLGDAMKAYRISQEGMTTRRGDVILPANEVSAVESAFQALGFQPVEQSTTYERRERVRTQDQAFQDRSNRIKNDYAKAVRQGDADGKEAARTAWKQLQEARVAKGYQRQPMSELFRAPLLQNKRERNTEGGVQFNKANRQFVESQV